MDLEMKLKRRELKSVNNNVFPEWYCIDCEKAVSQTSHIITHPTHSRFRRVYYCTICGKHPVNAENGFDTCDDCRGKA